MTPTQSRELASLIQTFSPSQKADFYYFTIVERQDPIAYVAQMRKHSLIDLLKASFGGDRSAAGKYAAEQRWKGNRKKDKPKTERKKKQPDNLDPRLGKATEIMASNFGGDAIAVLRKAIAISTTLRDGYVIESRAAEPTAEEIRLTVAVEEVGRLIGGVIDEELKKLDATNEPKRSALVPELVKLQLQVAEIKEKEGKFATDYYEVTDASYRTVHEQVESAMPAITRPVSSELRVISERESIITAVRQASQLMIIKLTNGDLTYEKAMKLSDGELLALIETDKSSWPSKGKTREAYQRNVGDHKLFLRDEDKSVWELADRRAAYLKVMRQQLESPRGFGSFIARKTKELGPADARNKVKNDLKTLQGKMTASTVTDKQRHDVIKSVLGKVGVKFGEAGQVPVELQFRKTDELLNRKVTSTRNAQDTPMGQKFQNLIDETVQLLPATLWRGSSNSTVIPSLDLSGLPADQKFPARVVLDIKSGRAHAQKIVTSQGLGLPRSQQTKLKLNSLKLNEEASPKWKSTALHEMGHAAEYGNSWITQLENAYWVYRAKGERLTSLKKLTGINYKAKEKGVKDAWGQIYAGKNYSYSNSRSNAWEIFTTGIEGVFYGGKTDPDHRAFTLGLLALSTQIKD